MEKNQVLIHIKKAQHKIVLVLIFAAIFLSGKGRAQKYEFKHLSMKEGLSHNNVTSILQDETGFLWFGTQGGLCSFDGYNVKKYMADPTNPNAISNNNIRSITEDADGYIWAATDIGLNRFDKETESFSLYLKDENDEFSLQNNEVTYVFCDSKNNLWVGTSDDGLSRYDYKTNQFIRYPYGVESHRNVLNTGVLCIYETSDEKLLIGGFSGLSIYDYKTETFSYIFSDTPGASLSHDNVRCIFEDKDKNLWVGTKTGVDVFTEQRTKVKHYRHNSNDINSLTNAVVYDITQDHTGKIWIATMDGLDQFDPTDTAERFVHFRSKEGYTTGLSSSSTWSLYTDKQNIVWIGTFGAGVDFTYADKKGFELYSHDSKNPKSISNSSALSFLEDSKGRIWIGTDGGGFNLFDKKTGTFTAYKHDDRNANSLVFNAVLGISEDARGRIWLGTWERGVDCFDPQKQTFTHYVSDINDPKSLSNNNVWTILNDRQNNLWLGTVGGGLNRFDTTSQSFIHYFRDLDNPENSTIGSNIIWYLYQDSKDRIWAGTNDGLALYNPQTDSFKTYTTNPKDSRSINHGWVVCVYEDSQKRLWVCTHGGGLDRFDPETETFTHYTEKDGLPNNIVMGITEDSHQNLWLATINSICKFTPQTQNQEARFLNYDATHGVQPSQFNLGAVLKSTDGTIYMGGKSGFNVFNPDSVKINQHLPTVVLSKFKIFDTEITIGENSPLKKAINETDEITIKYAQSVITFDFAALNFIESEKNQYAYKLQGFDKRWNKVGNKRSATYTNLNPGTYRLFIKASNNDGVWNEKAKIITLHVLPPWWMTWWFRILLVTILVAGVFSYMRIRINGLERQKKMLKQKVAERTSELLKANTNLQEKQEEILLQSDAMKETNEVLAEKTDQLSEANVILEEKQQEILQQSEEMYLQNERLAWQHEQIKSSIRYAQRIQNAILPMHGYMNQFVDFFVLFRPKDIVSGDFYWFTQLHDRATDKNFSFVVVGDCTGHGVPGAFMSMIGNSLLNEIIRIKQNYEPADILNALNKGIVKRLQQERNDNNDGMDIAVCRLEPIGNNTVQVTYAGAKMPLFYITPNEHTQLQIVDPDHKSIGGYRWQQLDYCFSQKDVFLKKGDIIYLTTDGFADQNSLNRKRFSKKLLRQILAQVSTLPFNEQQARIESILNEFMGDVEQRDDITLFGCKV